MKVLHINSYYSVSPFYKHLYEKQIDEGLDVDVYVPVSKDKDISELELGEYSHISKNHGKYDRYVFTLKHSKIYNDVIKKYDIDKFDIIHAHSLFSNGYIAYKLNQKYDIPYIVAVRNTDVNLFFKKMIHLRHLGIKILKNAKNVIFISSSYKEEVINKFIPEDIKEELSKKSKIVTNGIDNFWLENKFHERKAPSINKLKILYVGVIYDNKNIETTIKACKRLIEQGYSVEYTIIGKIKDENYNSIIKENFFINYIPHTDKTELLKHYRESDIFIMPSEKETFGLVYLEAMSQGLPVIYTRGQGFDGNFKDGEVGYSVKHNDDLEVYDRINDILKDYDSISNNCLKEVDNFSWDKIAKKYTKIYLND